MEMIILGFPVVTFTFIGTIIYSIHNDRLKAYFCQTIIYTFILGTIATACFPIFGTIFGFASYFSVAMLLAGKCLDFVRDVGDNNEKK